MSIADVTNGAYLYSFLGRAGWVGDVEDEKVKRVDTILLYAMPIKIQATNEYVWRLDYQEYLKTTQYNLEDIMDKHISSGKYNKRGLAPRTFKETMTNRQQWAASGSGLGKKMSFITNPESIPTPNITLSNIKT